MTDLAYISAMTPVHPPDDMESNHASATRHTPHSTFRRSLTLSHGAAALLTRGFSRSSGRGRSSSNAAETPASAEEDQQRRQQHQQQPRRATIATTTNTSSDTDDVPSLHVRIVPNIENPSRCIIFDIVDREMKAGSVIKIGRFAERSPLSADHMSFKSKVVSRSHCEIWVHQDGKLYIRDTSSSSGTFLNHIRLSPASQESPATEIKHGDIVQLGVDYQGGQEEIYRSVKMRFELNSSRKPRPLSFSMSQFNNLRTLSRVASNHGENSSLVLVDEEQPAILSRSVTANNDAERCAEKLCSNASSCSGGEGGAMSGSSGSSSSSSGEELPEVDECCICLYALAPFQALFVAPCSHSFHFMCIRSLLQSYPGFQCPICRTYSDLEASVAIEPEEVMQKYGLRCKSFTPPPEAAFEAGHQQTGSNAPPPPPTAIPSPPQPQPEPQQQQQQPQPQPQPQPEQQQQQQSTVDEPPAPATEPEHVALSPVPEQGSSDPGPSTSTSAGILVSNGSAVRDAAARDRRTVFVSDDMDVIEIPPVHEEEPEPPSPQPRPISRSVRAPASTAHPERRLSAANLMEKLKMTFFEKRKSSVIMSRNEQQRRRKRSNKPRPLSYPNFLIRQFSRDEDDVQVQPAPSSSSSSPSQPTPSQQSSSQHNPRSQSATSFNSLSRQSTTHLAEIQEETESIHYNQQQQPMAVDT